ncbi:MAG: DMP19 family protein [Clostridia bacterium]|nr:DMP19 family protein [Clostridia bacterium]
MTLTEIWEISDVNGLIIALSDYVAEKCAYGDAMEALSAPERVFYITQSLEMEVNNGGFSQFFYNASGDFCGELISALTEIGALKTAEISRRALAAFGKELPTDRDERCEMLDELESDEIDAILEECDNAFYDYEDDLEALNHAYVLKNKASFA